MDKGDVALDGVVTFSALIASLFGALYPSEGYVNALFFSFLLTIFSTPLYGLLHHRCRVNMRHVIACDIGLLLQGPLMLLVRNPLGPWALLVFLMVPAIPIPVSRLGQPPEASARYGLSGLSRGLGLRHGPTSPYRSRRGGKKARRGRRKGRRRRRPRRPRPLR